MAIIHVEQKHMKKLMKILLFYKGKTKERHCKVVMFVFASFFFFVTSVDNAIEASCRIILYPLLQKLFFCRFCFQYNQKATNDFLKK